MTEKTNNMKLGVFIVAGTALFLVLLVMLGAGTLFLPKVVFETYFDSSVQGLEVGSPVKFRGVQIGEVSSIMFVGDEYPEAEDLEKQYVLVRMELVETDGRFSELEERLDEYVKQGMRLRLATQGITGISYLSADYLKDAPPPMEPSWEPEHTYVPSAPTDLAMFTESVQSIAEDLEQSDISAIADDVRVLIGRVNETIDKIDTGKINNKLVASLDKMDNTLEGVESFVTDVREAKPQEELKATIRSLKEAIEEFDETRISLSSELTETLQKSREVMEDLQAKMEGEQVAGTLEEFRRAAERIPRMIENLDRLIADTEGLVEANRGDVQSSIRNINEISQQIRALTETLQKYPSLAVFGEPPPELEVYE